MTIAALESQKALRDLIQLPKLAEELRWISDQNIPTENNPLVICGIWLSVSKDNTARLLAERSKKGFGTIIIPRFKAGDLASVLQAPSAIDVVPSDFESFQWEDGQPFDIPGVTYFQTSLHAGRWGIAAGLGPVVLCYRPHAAAGPIVLCSAALFGRPFGVKVADQQELLSRLLAKMKTTRRDIKKEETIDSEEIMLADLDSYLTETDDQGALVLFLLYSCGGDRDANLYEAARKFNLRVEEEKICRFLKILPETSHDEIRKRLEAYGWGAYLRRLPNSDNIEST
jgi:hypothetical protein